MNGDLERMVYNGAMDIATYNSWVNFLNKLGELAWYFIIPFLVLVIVLMTVYIKKNKWEKIYFAILAVCVFAIVIFGG